MTQTNPAPKAKSTSDTAGRLAIIRKILEDKKGIDITVLDVSEVTGVADYFVIVSGTSAPHLKAMVNAVQVELKHGEKRCLANRAGDPESGWLVLDYMDIIIHIFLPKVRQYYALEDLWNQAPRVK